MTLNGVKTAGTVDYLTVGGVPMETDMYANLNTLAANWPETEDVLWSEYVADGKIICRTRPNYFNNLLIFPLDTF